MIYILKSSQKILLFPCWIFSPWIYFFFDRLLQISKVHQKAKRSFVIVSLKSIPDSIADDLICVPTPKEAYDLIEMEEMQRDLGF